MLLKWLLKMQMNTFKKFNLISQRTKTRRSWIFILELDLTKFIISKDVATTTKILGFLIIINISHVMNKSVLLCLLINQSTQNLILILSERCSQRNSRLTSLQTQAATFAITSISRAQTIYLKISTYVPFSFIFRYSNWFLMRRTWNLLKKCSIFSWERSKNDDATLSLVLTIKNI